MNKKNNNEKDNLGLLGIKKINRIVFVDDVRTLTDEDMKKIWEEIDKEDTNSEE